jgi:hypothetical protein
VNGDGSATEQARLSANEVLARIAERAEAAQRESDEVFRVMADDPNTIIGLYDTAGTAST